MLGKSGVSGRLLLYGHSGISCRHAEIASRADSASVSSVGRRALTQRSLRFSVPSVLRFWRQGGHGESRFGGAHRAALWTWCGLLLAIVLLPGRAWAASGLDAQEVLNQLQNVKVDPGQVYVLRHAQLIRDRVKLFFNRGYIGFFTQAAGEITGAVYIGEGEILLIPPTRVEKESLARFIHSPILEEQFTMAILRFTDQTARELIAVAERPEPDDPERTAGLSSKVELRTPSLGSGGFAPNL